MCRWGCATLDTTFMCKWCGTRFCRECLRGDFMAPGLKMTDDPLRCRQCNQIRCVGARVEYVPGSKKSSDEQKMKGRGKSARKVGASSAKKSRPKSTGKKKKKRK